MIYIITENESKFPLNPIYRFGTKQMLLSWMELQKEIPIDAETRGFDPYTKNLLSLQIGDAIDQYIVDCESMTIEWLKTPLESKILIGQNIKFDLKFLYKKGIYPRKIYDTFVVEKVLNCGLDHIRASLDELTERYLKINLDKSIRVDIPKEGLTPRVISYAADDIKYLPALKAAQLLELNKKDLLDVAKLENMFTPALAYIEYCGFKLDESKWRAKMLKDQDNLSSLQSQLNHWVLDSNMQNYIEQQVDMFRERECIINWSSPKQMVSFFESIGIDCSVTSGGETKKSVEEPVIKKYIEKFPIVKLYLDFKKAEKLTTTYGDNFLIQINPVTNRLHTNFKQILDTGRMSSGGKDRDLKVNLINFQNIPKDEFTRSCFVAEEGNMLIIADYSAQEQIVLANISMDAGLLEFYDKKLYGGDMHCYVSSRIWPELQSLTKEQIKSEHSDKRNKSKAVSFSLNYGGAGSTIADNLNIPKEEGEKLYDAYFEVFPGLKQHFDVAKQQGLNDGYILISHVTRRKSYLFHYDKYAVLASKMDKKYWMRYREEKAKESETFSWMRKEVKDYFYYKGEIERKGLNFPVQGQSAETLKIAIIYLYNWILDNNYFGIVKICNAVHDEVVPECPIGLAEQVAKVTKEFMEKAGRFYCKRVPLGVDPEISAFWKK